MNSRFHEEEPTERFNTASVIALHSYEPEPVPS